MKLFNTALTLTVASILFSVNTQAQTYNVRVLQQVEGLENVHATTLNNRGIVAGLSYSEENYSLVKWSRRGSISDTISMPENTSLLQVKAINSMGFIAGTLAVSQAEYGYGLRRAFITDESNVPQFLPLPFGVDGSIETILKDMNDLGDAVGIVEDDEADQSFLGSFIYHDGQTQMISSGRVIAINNRQEVLLKESGGLFLVSGLLGAGAIERVQIPDFDNEGITGIDLNNNGDVLYNVFTLDGSSNYQTIIRTRAGQIVRLPLLRGFEATLGYSINDSREVVGQACGLYEEGDEVCAPFLYSQGRMINGRMLLGQYANNQSLFLKINNGGEILAPSQEQDLILLPRVRLTSLSSK